MAIAKRHRTELAKHTFEYAPAPESTDFVKIEPHYGLFIGGKMAAAHSKKRFATINPATEQKLSEVVEADGARLTYGEWDRAAAVCEDVLASPAVPHARGAAAGMLGLVHAMRGATRQARPHLLESHLIATRIELVPMEMFSSWGLCVLESSAGSCAEAADRARRMLARLARTQERHFSVLILQWMAAFFAEQEMDADVRACAAALAGMAETTGQPVEHAPAPEPGLAVAPGARCATSGCSSDREPSSALSS